MKNLLRTAVTVFALFAFSLPAAAQNKADHTAAIARGRAAAQALVRNGPVPGLAVAVAKNGQIVWSEGFGFADIERQAPVTRETRFGLGSISKSLTTALFAQLVEEGKATWDEPIENHLPDFPHKGKKISVRWIAGHLSGLGDNFNTTYYTTNKHFSTTDEVLKEFYAEPLIHPPGTKHEYATTSYTLIAGVVERTSGRSFEKAMQDLVLDPLKLRSILPNNPSNIIPGRTSFYVLDDAKNIKNAPFSDPSSKIAGAGYLSTADDLTRFGMAMLKPGFLKKSSLDELFYQVKTTSGEQSEFALGWRIDKDKDGRRVIYQPGGGPGLTSMVFLYPEQEVVITILCNRRGVDANGLYEALVDAFINNK